MGGGECYKQRFYPCSVSLITIEMCRANLLIKKFARQKFFRIFQKYGRCIGFVNFPSGKRVTFLLHPVCEPFVFKVFD